ncbi:hypothetical protein [Streptomyces sp. NBC_00986]|uniref:hypothetical protein n=1 Tax=Streptomyces sp. NBC_00986 TaxID=2903702 RepID=UPI003866060E|nr:hypothetical protein OG504_33190 [Streptomyces sp. NBC_00986]
MYFFALAACSGNGSSVKGNRPAQPPVAPARSCSAIGWIDDTGDDPQRDLIEEIYEAACQRDYSRLQKTMGDGFHSQYGSHSAPVTIRLFKEFDASRKDIETLPRLLEGKPVTDQGGITYVLGRAVAVFPRPVQDTQPSWSLYVPNCSAVPDLSVAEECKLDISLFNQAADH